MRVLRAMPNVKGIPWMLWWWRIGTWHGFRIMGIDFDWWHDGRGRGGAGGKGRTG